jgi:hypothetical protein
MKIHENVKSSLIKAALCITKNKMVKILDIGYNIPSTTTIQSLRSLWIILME